MIAACRSEWGADVPWDPSRLRDPGDHPVGVATVDRLARKGAQHQRACGAFAPAGLENSEDGHGQRHGGGLVALADQVEHAVSAQRFGVVLDPHRGRFGGAQRVDAEQVGQGAVGGR